MQPMGEISPNNRYMTQPAFHGGFVVIDRVNGNHVVTGLTTGEEAAEAAKNLNSGAVKASQ